MPTFADYLVLRDRAFILPTFTDDGLANQAVFEFDPSPDIRRDDPRSIPILSFRVHPKEAKNLTLTVSVRNETGATREVLELTFNDSIVRTIHEAIEFKDDQGLILGKNNRIFFKVDGDGNLALSDIIVWYKRFVD